MTRRRQKDPEAGVSSQKQDGAEASAHADAVFAKRLEVAAKLERFARQENDSVGALQNPSTLYNPGDAGTSEGEKGEGRQPAAAAAPDTMHQAQGNGESPEPTIKDVFTVVSSIKSAVCILTQQMQDIKEDISNTKADLNTVTGRTTVLEERVGTNEDDIAGVKRVQERSVQRISELIAKTDDLENRLRRNNLRIIGIPEKTEGNTPTEFIENWLKNKFGPDALTSLFAVERAHRVPSRPLPPGRPPRPMLAKILHYRDRDTILRKARDMPDLLINGHEISIFPDYSSEVQKQRMKFMEVKKRLRNLGLSYSMMYPARLRLVALKETHFFSEPGEATKWLDQHERQIRLTVTGSG